MNIPMWVIVVMCMYAFMSSPLLGVMLIGYVIFTENKMKQVYKLNSSLISVRQKPTKRLNMMGKTTPMSFDIYKRCFIEKWGEGVYSITTPKGERLDKEFRSIKMAKREIDSVESFLEPASKPRRSKITNVRFVR